MCRLKIIFAIGIFVCLNLFAQEKDLAEFDLQDLTNIEVTLVSRKKENLFQAAAAVHVITQEDIAYSGVTSIPEALRLVPGIQVASIDANKWAITSRGFIGRFSNKLLVLIDGRVVYNHLFSGVFWDMHDVMMEDIDRIEVIRGPGATLWGANAVNGIINIVTKNARETQGALIKAGVGTEEKQNEKLRYGGKQGDHFYYRGYVKYFNRDAFVDSSGNPMSDGWDVLRGGLRWDWEPTAKNQLSFIGSGYSGNIGHRMETVSLEAPYKTWIDYKGYITGYDALASWQTYFSNASVLKIIVVHDFSEREEGIIKAQFRMTEIDASYLFDLGKHHQFVSGVGYRLSQDQYTNRFRMTMIPSQKNLPLWSAFVQDNIHVIPKHFRVTLGSKFEHNVYSGFEIQPNLRLLFIPHQKMTFWAAVSRAVRTPARAERGGYYIADVMMTDQSDQLKETLIVVRMQGNPDFRPETLVAYEMGWRWSVSNTIYLDAATFYNRYNHIFSGFIENPYFETNIEPNHFVMPLLTDNRVAGHGFGFEMLSEIKFSRLWHLNMIYSFTKLDMHLIQGSTDTGTPENYEGQCPLHMGGIQSKINVSASMDFSLNLHYMDSVWELSIPEYWNMDMQFRWKPFKCCRIALVGHNLLHDRVLEFKPELDYTQYTCSQRGIYTNVEFRF